MSTEVKEIKDINKNPEMNIIPMFRFGFEEDSRLPCIDVNEMCKKWVYEMDPKIYEKYLAAIPEMIKKTLDIYRPKDKH